MRFFWRSDDDPLSSYSAWVDRIDHKNRQPGTSAPTLATVWAGPLDLLGALGTHPDLAGLTVHTATVEKKTEFDEHGGNVRNHDLVVRASTGSGERVAVCVEAKAGEPLGLTLADSEGSDHAVFALHEFRTDQRPEDKSALNGSELTRFGEVILGSNLPGAEATPWCVQVPKPDGVTAQLYVAHVVTDLTTATLTGAAAKQTAT